jgi:hypothetical protein
VKKNNKNNPIRTKVEAIPFAISIILAPLLFRREEVKVKVVIVKQSMIIM